MMPRRRRRAPADPALHACIQRYRVKAARKPMAKVWKSFRGSRCGERWLDALHSAYGHRCLYCDHAEGGTIDHKDGKAKTPSRGFAWSNHRPSCGDCNRDKGERRVVDPLAEDPRDFLVFDVKFGTPRPRPGAGPARREKAEATLPLLDKHTLREARREKVLKVVDTMTRFCDGEPGYDVARVLAELADDQPHRAVVRDLVLDADEGLHRWSPLVREVTRRIPDLRAWALSPLEVP